ncbi:hypothetical protein MPSEU_000214300 [Mayamaea pseudoterrestris]|nr:hypothetical protein MPSEU_000214300 [Mayamaea pseudoterrestris]
MSVLFRTQASLVPSRRLQNVRHVRWTMSLLLSARVLGCHAFSIANNAQCRLDSRCYAESASDISTDRLVQIGRASFQSHFSHPLDDWQCEAGGAISEGSNVIVCAPTGAGKTVVGEMALIHATQLKRRGIYTTPLKALSNQKYTELISRFSGVGLSTGDISINKGAAVTVMTTEVFRNQASRFGSSTNNDNSLEDTSVVVLDEFHYMGLPGRGSVWEESVITSPDFVQLIALSATLSNARQLAEWIEHVTQRPTILVQVPDSQRPVPLRYLFATRDGLFSLFQDPDAGPGAPHGMLGWKADGYELEILESESESNDKKGFGLSKQAPKKKKLPRGLQINPALKAAAEKRMQRVNRAFERAKFEASLGVGRGRRRFEDNDEFFNKLKGAGVRKLSAKDEQKERERLLKKEMRRSVPSLSALVQRLDQKELLPAIFFLFSRAGCDEAARGISQSMRGPRDPNNLLVGEEQVDWKPKRKNTKPQKSGAKRASGLLEDSNGRVFRSGSNYIDEDFVSAIYESEVRARINGDEYEESSPLSPRSYNFFASAGLLKLSQVEEVANRVAQFNKNNPEISFEEDVIEQFLCGVGSHHAGQLPAHKSFVESLFQRQLMKAVFATETLAAGINMPARTTVICALAKRGDGSSMNLLETSNLLQMAGRAGRRGMDTSGTCVILATPFESENDAGKILTDDIKPIMSQFTPSYTLAVNLIARGEGSLDVAKTLVQKSFAMWQKRLYEETTPSIDDDLELDVCVSSGANFFDELVKSLQLQVNKRSAKHDTARIESMLDLLNNPEHLKKVSKSFTGLVSLIEVERATVGYLEQELQELQTSSFDTSDDFLSSILHEDEKELMNQILLQRDRVSISDKDLKKHPFSTITNVANDIMADEAVEGLTLRNALNTARRDLTDEASKSRGTLPLTGLELSSYAKHSIVMRRRTRKTMSRMKSGGTDAAMQHIKALPADDAWSDLLAITRTLIAYGCLKVDPALSSDSNLEQSRFKLTDAGINVGMLGFENSLWCLVAMGGAWDVAAASHKLDASRKPGLEFTSDAETGQDDVETFDISLYSQREAADLTDKLRTMSISELAGYVSCLVSDFEAKGDGSITIVDRFQRLTKKQQKSIQSSLVVLERFMEVQKVFSVDEKPRRCTFDISNCEVVTEWAAGCSWNEALALADVPPGDLVRTLSRALDGLRQLGNLPFTPLRKGDLDESSSADLLSPRGLHPEVRKLCRDAAKAINRYPVKDFLTFDTGEQEDDDDMDMEDTIDDVRVPIEDSN